MNDETITQTVLFPDRLDRPVMATFDQPHASSDGGAVLLKAADHRLGLLTALTATVPDARASAARDARGERSDRATCLRDRVWPSRWQ